MTFDSYRPADEASLALTDARANLTDLVNKAQFQQRSTMITRHGCDAARIVPPTDTDERDAMCSHSGDQRHCEGDGLWHGEDVKCCVCFDALDVWRHRHPETAAWLDRGWEANFYSQSLPGAVGMPRQDKALRAQADLERIGMTGPYRDHPAVALYLTHLSAGLAYWLDRRLGMRLHLAVRAGSSFNQIAARTNRPTAELAARWTDWSWGQAAQRDPGLIAAWREEHYDEHAAVADDVGPGWRRMWDEGLDRYTTAEAVPDWQTILDSRPHADHQR